MYQLKSRLRELQGLAAADRASGHSEFDLQEEEDDFDDLVFEAVCSLTEPERLELLRRDDVWGALEVRRSHSDDITGLRGLIKGLSVACPAALAGELVRRDARSERPGKLTYTTAWCNIIEYDKLTLPVELHGAVVLAEGLALGIFGLQDGYPARRLHTRLGNLGCENSPQLLAGALIARDDAVGTDQLERVGIRARLQRLIQQDATQLVPLVGWLLLRGSPTDISFLTNLVLQEPEALAELKRIASDETRRESASALGLLHLVQDGFETPGEDFARWASDSSSFLLPSRLSAPSSVWLNDASLENMLRSAVDAAAEELRMASFAKEDVATGALLGSLRRNLESFVQRGGGASHPGALCLKSVTTPSNGRAGEIVNGADLALLLEIDVPGRMKSTRAHLVQVKRTKADGRGSPRWHIDVAQLKKLLSFDPTATYWLLSDEPRNRVLCVPASLLVARARATLGDRFDLDGMSLAVAYESVIGSAAIPLGQLVVDLVIGLWAGSEMQAAIDVAQGRNTSYTPEGMLHLTIGARSDDDRQ